MRLASALALSFLCCTSLAHADALPRLTDRGRVMLGGSLGGYLATKPGPGLYGYPEIAAWLQPSLVYFVRDRVGIGAYAGYEYTARSSSGETSRRHGLGAGLTAMVELPLGPKLGLLSVVQLGYLHQFTERDLPASFNAYGQTRDSGRDDVHGHLAQIVVEGALPVLIHASSSIAFGFGPTVRWAPYVGASSDYPGATHLRPLRVGASSWIGVSF